MPRPIKCRKVCHYPQTLEFYPGEEKTPKEPIVLTIDEYEVIRLIDKEGYSQVECGEFMGVARTTIQRVYECARKKLADTLVEGRPLKIEGGDFFLCEGKQGFCNRRECFKCKRTDEMSR